MGDVGVSVFIQTSLKEYDKILMPVLQNDGSDMHFIYKFKENLKAF